MKKYIPALTFDFLTGYYDWVIKKVMPTGFRDVLVKQLHLSPNEVILDFGTGTAELAILIKRKETTTSVTGVDVDTRVLQIAKNKITEQGLDIHTLQYDGTRFPFKSDHFDKVVSCLVFHHLNHDQKKDALSEIFRVLKKGGRLYISDWGLERNPLKVGFLKLFKNFKSLKILEEHSKGMLPKYIMQEGFKNVAETSFLETYTGTLCYYEAEKEN